MEVRRRVRIEQERLPRFLREVEVLREVTEDRRALADVRPRIRSPVGPWVERSVARITKRLAD